MLIILSAIFGLKFQQTKHEQYLQKQIEYFNRSLGQLTAENCDNGELKCPELYYLQNYLQNGQYLPNDATPLLWTQANLMIAFKMMSN